MRLSIVTTLYRSAPYIEEFCRRAGEAAARITDDYEIVLVNDGSPDDSLAVAVAAYERDPHIRVIDLSRNFGHHRAMMTGLAHARGDRVFLLDADLEQQPELLPQFAAEMERSGADVVYGVQSKRTGGLGERVIGSLYYKLFNFLSSTEIPANIVTMRLMTRRYVAALVRHREREILIAGLWVITGFEQVPLEISRIAKGSTTYTLKRKMTAFVNGITAFSNRPLIYVFYMGMTISFVSVIAAAVLVVRKLFFGYFLAGWPSLIVSIWLLGGLTISCLGIIGIYIAKLFSESKRRPYAIIREVYERPE
ncbi:MAG TPA: glycosyltransferase family 2 protein [Thermoanaerobaculia bacterium]|jgi:putative glycosyltransferase